MHFEKIKLKICPFQYASYKACCKTVLPNGSEKEDILFSKQHS
jgi:hypothetical protein